MDLWAAETRVRLADSARIRSIFPALQEHFLDTCSQCGLVLQRLDEKKIDRAPRPPRLHTVQYWQCDSRRERFLGQYFVRSASRLTILVSKHDANAPLVMAAPTLVASTMRCPYDMIRVQRRRGWARLRTLVSRPVVARPAERKSGRTRACQNWPILNRAGQSAAGS